MRLKSARATLRVERRIDLYPPPAIFPKRDPEDLPAVKDIRSARVLALLGDSITTDHISPAGSIPVDGPGADTCSRAGQTERFQLLWLAGGTIW